MEWMKSMLSSKQQWYLAAASFSALAEKDRPTGKGLLTV
jgi:hypothetical protein